ncbi:MAG TPA: PP2C family protein-serine/threonine phosphatase [Bryobacteraceae bacterium]|nr:PP2C family protein-serine/threonine phosphatase [Bryobacteraceae bacterium]
MPQHFSPLVPGLPHLAGLHNLAAPRLASDVAAGIQNIQDTLLPLACCADGVECAGECERSGNLGGDFFDFLLPHANEVLAAIGNVAVAGAAGSILTTGLHVCLRLLGARGVTPADLSGEINRTLWQMSPDHAYATMFCARINPRREILTYVNAGHETALIVRGDFRMERLEPNGPVLGFSRPFAYRERTTAFRPGDTLIAVSDGVSETSEADCEQDLLRILRKKEFARVPELPGKILEAIRDLAGASSKDRTVIVVRYRPYQTQGAHAGLPSPRRTVAAAA